MAAAPLQVFNAYASRLGEVLRETDWSTIVPLAEALFDCWQSRRQVFLLGNGGSASTAGHLANDLLYPVSRRGGSGLRVHALTGNPATLTCLANDEGYERVFAIQLAVLAEPGDLLIAFSGSGNSPNVIAALDEARRIGMRSFAVLGFDGGLAKEKADCAIHFAVHDMQISEDLQMVVGNMILQYLHSRRDEVAG